MNDNEKSEKSRYTRSAKWQLMATVDTKSHDYDVIPFTVAEMEWETPPPIVSGLKNYLDQEILGYTIAPDSYYNALTSWTSKHYGYSVKKEEIFITTGVISALKIALHTMTAIDDGVIVLTPSYNAFFDVIKNTKRQCVKVALDYQNDYYTINELLLEESFANPLNTMFILCSPHNPIGRVWTLSELQLIHDLAKKHNVTVISDEIHADLIMPENKFVSYTHIDPLAVICTSITKTFNLAGLKLSNTLIKDPEIMKKWNLHSDMYGGSGANALAIRALELAYTECDSWYEKTLSNIYQNYELIRDRLADSKFKVIPLEATYLLWIDCSEVADSYKQLSDAHQHVGPGHWYGSSKDFIRINIAGPKQYLHSFVDTLLEIEKNTQ